MDFYAVASRKLKTFLLRNKSKFGGSDMKVAAQCRSSKSSSGVVRYVEFGDLINQCFWELMMTIELFGTERA